MKQLFRMGSVMLLTLSASGCRATHSRPARLFSAGNCTRQQELIASGFSPSLAGLIAWEEELKTFSASRRGARAAASREAQLVAGGYSERIAGLIAKQEKAG